MRTRVESGNKEHTGEKNCLETQNKSFKILSDWCLLQSMICTRAMRIIVGQLVCVNGVFASEARALACETVKLIQ